MNLQNLNADQLKSLIKEANDQLGKLNEKKENLDKKKTISHYKKKIRKEVINETKKLCGKFETIVDCKLKISVDIRPQSEIDMCDDMLSYMTYLNMHIESKDLNHLQLKIINECLEIATEEIEEYHPFVPEKHMDSLQNISNKLDNIVSELRDNQLYLGDLYEI